MKIVVYTLGCKVNQYESDGLIYSLKSLGHEVYSEIVPADIYILNSLIYSYSNTNTTIIRLHHKI